MKLFEDNTNLQDALIREAQKNSGSQGGNGANGGGNPSKKSSMPKVPLLAPKKT
jgi:hypothetical protein